MNPTLTTGLQLSLRAAIAAALAIAIAHYFNLQNPIYALIAAVIVMDLSPAKTRQLAVQRLLGTLVGATVGAVVSFVLPPGPFAIGVGIAMAMLLSYVVQVRAAAKLAGFVCGIIVLSHGTDVWSYAMYRLIETLLGIALAVLVSFVPKLLRVEIPEGTDAPTRR